MESPQKRNLVLILWVQFLVFIIMLAGVSYYLTLNSDPLDVDTFTNSDLHKMFMGGGVFFALLSYVVPSLLLKNWKQTMKAPENHIIPFFTIKFAFTEMVSLFGFCCVFLSKNFQNGIPFYVAGLVLFLLYFPSKEKLNNIHHLR